MFCWVSILQPIALVREAVFPLITQLLTAAIMLRLTTHEPYSLVPLTSFSKKICADTKARHFALIKLSHSFQFLSLLDMVPGSCINGT